MSTIDTNRPSWDYSGKYAESPFGKMYLNRTKDPVLAVKAVSEQKKLVELITGMSDETPELLKEITDLLKTGVDPSVPDYNLSLYYAGKNFYSPIHYTVKKDMYKTTELLLSYKASPNVLDRYSVTPTHLAADVGSLRCLKKLIEYRADVNAKTQQFRKPSRGATSSLTNCCASAPASLSSRAMDFTSLRSFIHSDIVAEYTQAPVVREGLKPEEFSFYVLPYEVGSTPLHLAAKKNHIECVKLLIDQGADYNAYDDKSQTPLYLAAKAGLPECVMVQLKNAVGFPILSIETKDSDTALHECLRHGEKMRECIKELVQVGADVSLHNIYHESAVHLAIKHKWDMDMIKLLIIEGYNMDFDRLKQSPRWKYNYERAKGSPLAQVVYGERRQQNPSSGVNRTSVSYSRDENLAVFFLRMGASRRSLKELLWHELNREAEGGLLLATLMDSFDYLPPISELIGRHPEEEDGHDHFLQDASSDEDTEMLDDGDANDFHHFPDFRPPNRSLQFNFNVVYDTVFPDPMFIRNPVNPPVLRHTRRSRLRFLHRRLRNWNSALVRRFGHQDQDDEDEDDDRNLQRRQQEAPARHQQQARQQTLPASLVFEKQQEYIRRCSLIPTLAHLSRSVVRSCMQARVREVIKFPIPTPLKEYILLGYPLVDREKVSEKMEVCIPEDGSAEKSGHPESIISDQE